MLVSALALGVPLTAGADPEPQTTIAPGLLEAAQAQPDSTFGVIVQGDAGTEAVAQEVENAATEASGEAAAETAVDDTFVTVSGVSATLTGDEVVALSDSSEPLVITRDSATTAADVTANIALPTILGTAQVGKVLTAEPGAWSGAPPLSYAFQWQRCGSSGVDCHEITGATGSAYTPVAADVGSALGVQVWASGSEGAAMAVSATTAVVAAAATPVAVPVSTEEPLISGVMEVGHVLSTGRGAWTGVGPFTYGYQWERCGKSLRSSAVLTDSPRGYWRLGEADGSAAAADASGHGLEGAYGGGVSYGVVGSAGGSNTAVRLNGTGAVEIPGIPASAFSTGFSFEVWFKASTAESDRSIAALQFSEGGDELDLRLNEAGKYEIVVGAAHLDTGRSPSIGFWDHLLATWDGSLLRLYRNASLLGAQALSTGLGEHDAKLILGTHSEAPPSVSGSLDEVALYDRPLSALDARTHYWGCEDIPGATQATYTPTAEDFGLRLLTFVTATNAGGTGVSASQPTAVITAQPPAITNPPSILGVAEQGQTLTAAHGTWDGTAPITFTQQWTRCDAAGANCIDIAGATDAAYELVAGDVGHTIRARIGAENVGGLRWSSSQASETVTATPEPLPAFKQQWPYVAGVTKMLADPAAQGTEPATIAIVDSGIDVSRADFGGRVIEQKTLTERTPNSPGDGYGHGTAVASVAAGSAEGYVGAAPNAKLVSIDVLDDNGVGNTSDVIAAADWIYENRDRLHIKVANFSLHGTNLASLVSDPLDKAVERLWQAGIVVVAASGNYAVDGKESAVPFAPGNDPFAITVGATDTRGTFTERDDVAAPWSAWGYTRDGFAKPEVVAPGRYIAAAVPAGSKLAQDRADRAVEPGYVQLSGTSLAAPVVSGTAVTMMEEHPNWSPDDVKGALMLTAKPLPQAAERSVGVGSIDAGDAAKVTDPPNPNLALNQFLVPDPAGGLTRVFDTTQWTHAVENDVAWGSVAWGSVAWGSAAWSSVAWGSVAWGSVAWGSVAWGSVAWGSVAWGSVAWGSTANDDVRPGGAYWVRMN